MTWRTFVDGNSLGFAAHTGAKQKLFAGGKETTAIFGVLRSMQVVMRERAASCPIVLWDGRSWRHDAFSEYKGTRDDDPKKAADRVAYKLQRPMMFKGLHLLGVRQLIASNMEADDLAGIVTRAAVAKGDKVALITGDKDWLQFVQPGVTWVDHKIDRKCTVANFHEFTGFRTPKAFVDAKALQGDAGDNIKPRTGIGGKGAQDLLDVFPCVDAFLTTPIVEARAAYLAHHGKKMPAKCEALHSDTEIQERFFWARSLMDLSSNTIPKPVNLRATHARIDRPAFEQFCAEHAFGSILNDMDRFLNPFEFTQQEHN